MQKFKSSVVSVSWERIHMYVKVRVDENEKLSENVQFFLVNNNYLVESGFQILEKNGNEYSLTLNVTNSGVNRCVRNGVYTLLVVDEDKISEAGYEGTSQMLESWGRCFRYLGETGAYTVTFLLDEYSEQSRFLLLFFNTVKRAMGNMIPLKNAVVQPVVRLAPHQKIMSKARKFAKKYTGRIRNKSYKMMHKYYHANKQKKQTILFMSEQDDKLALNMQALLDRMKERGVNEQFDIRFSLRKGTSVEQTILSDARVVKEVSRADLIIVDDHVPLFDKMLLKEETKMIQIWHAGAGFKGVGYSRWGHLGCPGPFSCHRQYDFCISGSSNISGFFSEQFGILDEQIIPTGMPRMDIYLNKENREKVTEKLYEMIPQAKGKKVILFAPTYRGRNRANAYYPYERVDFEKLYQFCKKQDYIVFFKMHPWVSQSVPIQEEHKECFFDLNTYPNINELFYITDLLITDYSSSIYEFSLMKKPMMFFVYDKVQYSASRGFHRDYDSTVPGKVCESFEEVMDALEKEDFEFEKVDKYIEDHFDFVDDHASDRIIDWLILGNLPENYKKALEEKRRYVESIRGISFAEYFLIPEEE